MANKPYTQAALIALENQFGAHNYAPLPVMLTRGQGVHVWDAEGKCYIDMMSAYSAVSLGHCHPKLVQVLTEQANKLAIVSRAFHHDRLGPYLQLATNLVGLPKALPMNTGAEAVETAIKAARKWAYTVKQVAANKAEIIACEGNFHGRTTTIVGLSSEPQYREGFGPYSPGLKLVPYGDVAALEAAITENTAAFLVEPIQGEGGIILPPDGYLRQVRALCSKHHVLMISDEVQTGLSRTGKFLALEHEGVQADGVILGKALGGGLLPVSLFLSRDDVMDVFTPGDHGSTFGGYSLAAAVGFSALQELSQPALIENSAKLGAYFLESLRKLPYALIKEVRGRGLFIGLEVQGVAAREVCLRLLAEGLLSKDTHYTVIRFAPPLIITREQIDEALVIIDKVLKSLS